MAKVSQVLSGETAIFYGKDLKAGVANLEPGLLVKLESGGSSVALAGSAVANKPFGMAFGGRYKPYTPTTRVFADEEPVTVVKGQFLALLSVDFFDEASLPTAGDALYCAESGKFTKNVTLVSVGRSIGTRVHTESIDGLGASQNLALVEVNIEP